MNLKTYLGTVGEGIDSQWAIPAVYESDGLVYIGHSDNGQDGSKDLLLHDRFPFLDISQHGWGYGQKITPRHVILVHPMHTTMIFAFSVAAFSNAQAQQWRELLLCLKGLGCHNHSPLSGMGEWDST